MGHPGTKCKKPQQTPKITAHVDSNTEQGLFICTQCSVSTYTSVSTATAVSSRNKNSQHCTEFPWMSSLVTFSRPLHSPRLVSPLVLPQNSIPLSMPQAKRGVCFMKMSSHMPQGLVQALSGRAPEHMARPQASDPHLSSCFQHNHPDYSLSGKNQIT